MMPMKNTVRNNSRIARDGDRRHAFKLWPLTVYLAVIIFCAATAAAQDGSVPPPDDGDTLMQPILLLQSNDNLRFIHRPESVTFEFSVTVLDQSGMQIQRAVDNTKIVVNAEIPDVELTIRVGGEGTFSAGTIGRTADIPMSGELQWLLEVKLPAGAAVSSVTVAIDAAGHQGGVVELSVVNVCAVAIADGQPGCDNFRRIVTATTADGIWEVMAGETTATGPALYSAVPVGADQPNCLRLPLAAAQALTDLSFRYNIAPSPSTGTFSVVLLRDDEPQELGRMTGVSSWTSFVYALNRADQRRGAATALRLCFEEGTADGRGRVGIDSLRLNAFPKADLRPTEVDVQLPSTVIHVFPHLATTTLSFQLFDQLGVPRSPATAATTTLSIVISAPGVALRLGDGRYSETGELSGMVRVGSERSQQQLGMALRDESVSHTNVSIVVGPAGDIAATTVALQLINFCSLLSADLACNGLATTVTEIFIAPDDRAWRLTGEPPYLNTPVLEPGEQACLRVPANSGQSLLSVSLTVQPGLPLESLGELSYSLGRDRLPRQLSLSEGHDLELIAVGTELPNDDFLLCYRPRLGGLEDVLGLGNFGFSSQPDNREGAAAFVVALPNDILQPDPYQMTTVAVTISLLDQFGRPYTGALEDVLLSVESMHRQQRDLTRLRIVVGGELLAAGVGNSTAAVSVGPGGVLEWTLGVQLAEDAATAAVRVTVEKPGSLLTAGSAEAEVAGFCSIAVANASVNCPLFAAAVDALVFEPADARWEALPGPSGKEFALYSAEPVGSERVCMRLQLAAERILTKLSFRFIIAPDPSTGTFQVALLRGEDEIQQIGRFDGALPDTDFSYSLSTAAQRRGAVTALQLCYEEVVAGARGRVRVYDFRLDTLPRADLRPVAVTLRLPETLIQVFPRPVTATLNFQLLDQLGLPLSDDVAVETTLRFSVRAVGTVLTRDDGQPSTATQTTNTSTIATPDQEPPANSGELSGIVLFVDHEPVQLQLGVALVDELVSHTSVTITVSSDQGITGETVVIELVNFCALLAAEFPCERLPTMVTEISIAPQDRPWQLAEAQGQQYLMTPMLEADEQRCLRLTVVPGLSLESFSLSVLAALPADELGQLSYSFAPNGMLKPLDLETGLDFMDLQAEGPELPNDELSFCYRSRLGGPDEILGLGGFGFTGVADAREDAAAFVLDLPQSILQLNPYEETTVTVVIRLLDQFDRPYAGPLDELLLSVWTSHSVTVDETRLSILVPGMAPVSGVGINTAVVSVDSSGVLEWVLGLQLPEHLERTKLRVSVEKMGSQLAAVQAEAEVQGFCTIVVVGGATGCVEFAAAADGLVFEPTAVPWQALPGETGAGLALYNGDLPMGEQSCMILELAAAEQLLTALSFRYRIEPDTDAGNGTFRVALLRGEEDEAQQLGRVAVALPWSDFDYALSPADHARGAVTALSLCYEGLSEGDRVGVDALRLSVLPRAELRATAVAVQLPRTLIQVFPRPVTATLSFRVLGQSGIPLPADAAVSMLVSFVINTSSGTMLVLADGGSSGNGELSGMVLVGPEPSLLQLSVALSTQSVSHTSLTITVDPAGDIAGDRVEVQVVNFCSLLLDEKADCGRLPAMVSEIFIDPAERPWRLFETSQEGPYLNTPVMRPGEQLCLRLAAPPGLSLRSFRLGVQTTLSKFEEFGELFYVYGPNGMLEPLKLNAQLDNLGLLAVGPELPNDRLSLCYRSRLGGPEEIFGLERFVLGVVTDDGPDLASFALQLPPLLLQPDPLKATTASIVISVDLRDQFGQENLLRYPVVEVLENVLLSVQSSRDGVRDMTSLTILVAGAAPVSGVGISTTVVSIDTARGLEWVLELQLPEHVERADIQVSVEALGSQTTGSVVAQTEVQGFCAIAVAGGVTSCVEFVAAVDNLLYEPTAAPWQPLPGETGLYSSDLPLGEQSCMRLELAADQVLTALSFRYRIESGTDAGNGTFRVALLRGEEDEAQQLGRVAVALPWRAFDYALSPADHDRGAVTALSLCYEGLAEGDRVGVDTLRLSVLPRAELRATAVAVQFPRTLIQVFPRLVTATLSFRVLGQSGIPLPADAVATTTVSFVINTSSGTELVLADGRSSGNGELSGMVLVGSDPSPLLLGVALSTQSVSRTSLTITVGPVGDIAGDRVEVQVVNFCSLLRDEEADCGRLPAMVSKIFIDPDDRPWRLSGTPRRPYLNTPVMRPGEQLCLRLAVPPGLSLSSFQLGVQSTLSEFEEFGELFYLYGPDGMLEPFGLDGGLGFLALGPVGPELPNNRLSFCYRSRLGGPEEIFGLGRFRLGVVTDDRPDLASFDLQLPPLLLQPDPLKATTLSIVISVELSDQFGRRERFPLPFEGVLEDVLLSVQSSRDGVRDMTRLTILVPGVAPVSGVGISTTVVSIATAGGLEWVLELQLPEHAERADIQVSVEALGSQTTGSVVAQTEVQGFCAIAVADGAAGCVEFAAAVDNLLYEPTAAPWQVLPGETGAGLALYSSDLPLGEQSCLILELAADQLLTALSFRYRIEPGTDAGNGTFRVALLRGEEDEAQQLGRVAVALPWSAFDYALSTADHDRGAVTALSLCYEGLAKGDRVGVDALRLSVLPRAELRATAVAVRLPSTLIQVSSRADTVTLNFRVLGQSGIPLPADAVVATTVSFTISAPDVELILADGRTSGSGELSGMVLVGAEPSQLLLDVALSDPSVSHTSLTITVGPAGDIAGDRVEVQVVNFCSLLRDDSIIRFDCDQLLATVTEIFIDPAERPWRLSGIPSQRYLNTPVMRPGEQLCLRLAAPPGLSLSSFQLGVQSTLSEFEEFGELFYLYGPNGLLEPVDLRGGLDSLGLVAKGPELPNDELSFCYRSRLGGPEEIFGLGVFGLVGVADDGQARARFDLQLPPLLLQPDPHEATTLSIVVSVVELKDQFDRPVTGILENVLLSVQSSRDGGVRDMTRLTILVAGAAPVSGVGISTTVVSIDISRGLEWVLELQLPEHAERTDIQVSVVALGATTGSVVAQAEVQGFCAIAVAGGAAGCAEFAAAVDDLAFEPTGMSWQPLPGEAGAGLALYSGTPPRGERNCMRLELSELQLLLGFSLRYQLVSEVGSDSIFSVSLQRQGQSEQEISRVDVAMGWNTLTYAADRMQAPIAAISFCHHRGDESTSTVVVDESTSTVIVDDSSSTVAVNDSSSTVAVDEASSTVAVDALRLESVPRQSFEPNRFVLAPAVPTVLPEPAVLARPISAERGQFSLVLGIFHPFEGFRRADVSELVAVRIESTVATTLSLSAAGSAVVVGTMGALNAEVDITLAGSMQTAEWVIELHWPPGTGETTVVVQIPSVGSVQGVSRSFRVVDLCSLAIAGGREAEACRQFAEGVRALNFQPNPWKLAPGSVDGDTALFSLERDANGQSCLLMQLHEERIVFAVSFLYFLELARNTKGSLQVLLLRDTAEDQLIARMDIATDWTRFGPYRLSDADRLLGPVSGISLCYRQSTAGGEGRIGVDALSIDNLARNDLQVARLGVEAASQLFQPALQTAVESMLRMSVLLPLSPTEGSRTVNAEVSVRAPNVELSLGLPGEPADGMVTGSDEVTRTISISDSQSREIVLTARLMDELLSTVTLTVEISGPPGVRGDRREIELVNFCLLAVAGDAAGCPQLATEGIEVAIDPVAKPWQLGAGFSDNGLVTPQLNSGEQTCLRIRRTGEQFASGWLFHYRVDRGSSGRLSVYFERGERRDGPHVIAIDTGTVPARERPKWLAVKQNLPAQREATITGFTLCYLALTSAANNRIGIDSIWLTTVADLDSVRVRRYFTIENENIALQLLFDLERKQLSRSEPVDFGFEFTVVDSPFQLATGGSLYLQLVQPRQRLSSFQVVDLRGEDPESINTPKIIGGFAGVEYIWEGTRLLGSPGSSLEATARLNLDPSIDSPADDESLRFDFLWQPEGLETLTSFLGDGEFSERSIQLTALASCASELPRYWAAAELSVGADEQTLVRRTLLGEQAEFGGSVVVNAVLRHLRRDSSEQVSFSDDMSGSRRVSRPDSAFFLLRVDVEDLAGEILHRAVQCRNTVDMSLSEMCEYDPDNGTIGAASSYFASPAVQFTTPMLSFLVGERTDFSVHFKYAGRPFRVRLSLLYPNGENYSEKAGDLTTFWLSRGNEQQGSCALPAGELRAVELVFRDLQGEFCDLVVVGAQSGLSCTALGTYTTARDTTARVVFDPPERPWQVVEGQTGSGDALAIGGDGAAGRSCMQMRMADRNLLTQLAFDYSIEPAQATTPQVFIIRDGPQPPEQLISMVGYDNTMPWNRFVSGVTDFEVDPVAEILLCHEPTVGAERSLLRVDNIELTVLPPDDLLPGGLSLLVERPQRLQLSPNLKASFDLTAQLLDMFGRVLTGRVQELSISVRAFVDSPRAADIDLIIRLPGAPATSGAGEVTQTTTVRFGTDALLQWNLDVRLPIELPQQIVQVEIEAAGLEGDTTVLKVLNFCAAALADGSSGCARFSEIVMDVKIIPFETPWELRDGETAENGLAVFSPQLAQDGPVCLQLRLATEQILTGLSFRYIISADPGNGSLSVSLRRASQAPDQEIGMLPARAEWASFDYMFSVADQQRGPPTDVLFCYDEPAEKLRGQVGLDLIRLDAVAESDLFPSGVQLDGPALDLVVLPSAGSMTQWTFSLTLLDQLGLPLAAEAIVGIDISAPDADLLLISEGGGTQAGSDRLAASLRFGASGRLNFIVGMQLTERTFRTDVNVTAFVGPKTSSWTVPVWNFCNLAVANAAENCPEFGEVVSAVRFDPADNPWQLTAEGTGSGYALQNPPIQETGSSCVQLFLNIESPLLFPAELSLDYRFRPETAADSFAIFAYREGASVAERLASFSAATEWTGWRHQVDASRPRFSRLSFCRDWGEESAAAEAGRLALDDIALRLRILEPVEDFCDLIVVGGKNGVSCDLLAAGDSTGTKVAYEPPLRPWRLARDESGIGYAVFSAETGDGEQSCLRLRLRPDPRHILRGFALRYRVQSQPDADQLAIVIHRRGSPPRAEQVGLFSGEVGWSTFSYTVTNRILESVEAISLCYSKDASGAVAPDRIAVAAIELFPDPRPPNGVADFCEVAVSGGRHGEYCQLLGGTDYDGSAKAGYEPNEPPWQVLDGELVDDPALYSTRVGWGQRSCLRLRVVEQQLLTSFSFRYRLRNDGRTAEPVSIMLWPNTDTVGPDQNASYSLGADGLIRFLDAFDLDARSVGVLTGPESSWTQFEHTVDRPRFRGGAREIWICHIRVPQRSSTPALPLPAEFGIDAIRLQTEPRASIEVAIFHSGAELLQLDPQVPLSSRLSIWVLSPLDLPGTALEVRATAPGTVLRLTDLGSSGVVGEAAGELLRTVSVGSAGLPALLLDVTFESGVPGPSTLAVVVSDPQGRVPSARAELPLLNFCSVAVDDSRPDGCEQFFQTASQAVFEPASKPWQLDPGDRPGNRALFSAPISRLEESCLRITIAEGRKVTEFSFLYTVSSERRYDFLVVSLQFAGTEGEERADRFSGNVPWQSFQLDLSSEQRAIRGISLCYTKDGSGSHGDDRAAVDNLVLRSAAVGATVFDGVQLSVPSQVLQLGLEEQPAIAQLSLQSLNEFGRPDAVGTTRVLVSVQSSGLGVRLGIAPITAPEDETIAMRMVSRTVPIGPSGQLVLQLRAWLPETLRQTRLTVTVEASGADLSPRFARAELEVLRFCSAIIAAGEENCRQAGMLLASARFDPPDKPWEASTSSRDDGNVLLSPDIAHNEHSCLLLQIAEDQVLTGLSFRFFAHSEAFYDRLAIRLQREGPTTDRLLGVFWDRSDWETLTPDIDPQLERITGISLCYRKDANDGINTNLGRDGAGFGDLRVQGGAGSELFAAATRLSLSHARFPAATRWRGGVPRPSSVIELTLGLLNDAGVPIDAGLADVDIRAVARHGGIELELATTAAPADRVSANGEVGRRFAIDSSGSLGLQLGLRFPAGIGETTVVVTAEAAGGIIAASLEVTVADLCALLVAGDDEDCRRFGQIVEEISFEPSDKPWSIRDSALYTGNLEASERNCLRLQIAADQLLERISFSFWLIGEQPRDRTEVFALSSPESLDTMPVLLQRQGSAVAQQLIRYNARQVAQGRGTELRFAHEVDQQLGMVTGLVACLETSGDYSWFFKFQRPRPSVPVRREMGLDNFGVEGIALSQIQVPTGLRLGRRIKQVLFVPSLGSGRFRITAQLLDRRDSPLAAELSAATIRIRTGAAETETVLRVTEVDSQRGLRTGRGALKLELPIGPSGLLERDLEIVLPTDSEQNIVAIEVTATRLTGDSRELSVLNFCAVAVAGDDELCTGFGEAVSAVSIDPPDRPWLRQTEGAPNSGSALFSPPIDDNERSCLRLTFASARVVTAISLAYKVDSEFSDFLTATLHRQAAEDQEWLRFSGVSGSPRHERAGGRVLARIGGWSTITHTVDVWRAGPASGVSFCYTKSAHGSLGDDNIGLDNIRLDSLPASLFGGAGVGTADSVALLLWLAECPEGDLQLCLQDDAAADVLLGHTAVGRSSNSRQMARRQALQYVRMGYYDINADRRVDGMDARLLLRYLSGLRGPTLGASPYVEARLRVLLGR